MQDTRQKILTILRTRGQATVDEIVNDLQDLRGTITPVTVRHHLSKLQDEGFIGLADLRHRTSPGRPQHIYELTNQGLTFFPNNFKTLAESLLSEIQRNFQPSQVNVILEGIAENMAQDANIPQGTLYQRLQAVIDYLNEHGYHADFEPHQNGYLLHTRNCPYHSLADTHQSLCYMDMQLISKMLGVVPRMASHKADGDETCSYFIPEKVSE